MLSARTLKLLDDLCAKSHDAYPEGGTLWTFVEAANQAHSRFRDSRRKPQAGRLDLKQLATWLEAAQGGDRGCVTAESFSGANELVGVLKSDLQVDEFLWAFDDAGYDMTANIYMHRSSDNRYFALEMWWSLD